MMLVQALALVFLCSSVHGWEIGCNSMDIMNNPTGPMTTAFPGKITCVRKPDGDIWSDVYSEKPFSGLMMQVQKRNGETVGAYRTARGNRPATSKHVGDDYLVGCPGNVAQYSLDQSDKTEALGTWAQPDDLRNAELFCVVTIIESAQRRYVKIRVPAVRGNTRPKKPDFNPSVQVRRTQASNDAPPPPPPRKAAPRPPPKSQPKAQPVRRPVARPAPKPAPRPSPRPAPSRGGRITVDGDTFLEHCTDRSNRKYTRIPVPNSDCNSYYTAWNGKIRAYQSCGLGMCASTSSCQCVPCSSMSCRSGSSTRQIVKIFDKDGIEAGTIENKRSSNSGGLSRSLNLQGRTNPESVPELSSRGGSSSSSSPSSSSISTGTLGVNGEGIQALLSLISG